MKSRLSLLILLSFVLNPISWAAPQSTDTSKTEQNQAVKGAKAEKSDKAANKEKAQKPTETNGDQSKPATEEPAGKSEEKKPDESKAVENKPAEAPKPATEGASASAAPGKPVHGDANAGKGKTQTCVACHGPDGNSTVPNWPKIAGQYQDYLVKQLKDFRLGEKGPRYEPSMYGMVVNLTDQDIADLAAFYASQKQTMGKAKEEYVAIGEKIYRGGNIQTGVTACLACHGPEGIGNEAAKFPKLAGQHAVYIENQLHYFRDGKRKNSPNGMMESISHRMNDEEIKAVSSYIEGLH
ncbi:MAG: c-type cytochrome [Gammaproteobacteria bacterium]|nr:c-type cytochrome [Gammaproteobacteria bacterium]